MRGAIIHRALPTAASLIPGGAAVWRDYNFGVGAVALGASAPNLVGVAATGLRLYGFDGAATLEQVFFALELDHDWKQGTPLHPHLHWLPSTTGAGNVIWNLEYSWVASEPNANGGLATASTTIQVTQAAPGVAYQVEYAVFPDLILPGALLIGSQFIARLYRDPTLGGDTYGADALLLTVGLHVQIDTLGSRTEDRK